MAVLLGLRSAWRCRAARLAGWAPTPEPTAPEPSAAAAAAAAPTAPVAAAAAAPSTEPLVSGREARVGWALCLVAALGLVAVREWGAAALWALATAAWVAAAVQRARLGDAVDGVRLGADRAADGGRLTDCRVGNHDAVVGDAAVDGDGAGVGAVGRGRAGRARAVLWPALAVALLTSVLLPRHPGSAWLVVLTAAAVVALVAGFVVFWCESWRPTQTVPAAMRRPPTAQPTTTPARSGPSAERAARAAELRAAPQAGDADARGAGPRGADDDGLGGPFVTRRSRERDGQ